MASTSTATTNSTDPAWVAPGNGIVGGYEGSSKGIDRVMMAFTAIALYNCAELITMILIRFKRRRGLYFWSLMITSCATVVYSAGIWAKMVNLSSSKPAVTLVVNNLGWIVMVTGNSFILYSRLHLITLNHRLLRIVFWGIVGTSTLIYIPTTTLTYGCTLRQAYVFCHGYSILERIQMTLITVQEFAISGVYLVEAYKYLKVVYGTDGHMKRVLFELLCVNVVLIILDIALLSIEYVDLYQIEVTFKGFVYSVKVKLELAVLSRLVKLVSRNNTSRSATWPTSLKLSDVERVDPIGSPTSEGGIDWLSRINSDGGGSSSTAETKGREVMSWSSKRSPVQEHAESIDFITSPFNERMSGRNMEMQDLKSALEEPPELLVDRGAHREALRSEPSRQSSITDMYPGRLTGDGMLGT